MLNAGGCLKAINLPQRALTRKSMESLQVLEKAFQLGLRMEDVIIKDKTDINASAERSWWKEIPCPNESPIHAFLGTEVAFCLSIGLLDLAVLHGQKDLAFRLAKAGIDFTTEGVFAIRGWLAGSVQSLGLQPAVEKQEVY